MGDQIFGIALKRRIKTQNKTGKRGRDKWVRDFRAPNETDDNSAVILARLNDKLVEWGMLDYVPKESIWSNGRGSRVNDPGLYGAKYWRDLFNNRQLLCHGTAVEVFHELLAATARKSPLDGLQSASFIYLALAIDRMIDYDSRYSTWDWTTGRVRHVFVRHEFSFKWTYAEMAPLVTSTGFEWTLDQTADCIEELVSYTSGISTRSKDLLSPLEYDLKYSAPLTITCKSATSLDHISDAFVDVIVIDPPYYDNVMYSELSDFFYVWLKRTAGYVIPDLCKRGKSVGVCPVQAGRNRPLT
jgi:adenine-specific DNA methylase